MTDQFSPKREGRRASLEHLRNSDLVGGEVWGIKERMNEAQEFLLRVVELSASERDFCKVTAVAGEVWVHTEENLNCRSLEHAGLCERPLPCRRKCSPLLPSC